MSNISKRDALIMLVVFIVSIVLIFVGQRNIGYFGLLLEVIGLSGLIFDLYFYNRHFK